MKVIKDIGSVVCAIIEKDGLFLIAQRPSDHALAGKYEFPGGKVSEGEKPSDAIVREINEELKVDIEVHSQLTPNHYTYPTISLTLIPFICSIKNGSPVLTEHEQFRWVDQETVQKYPLSEADIPILEEYLLLRRSS